MWIPQLSWIFVTFVGTSCNFVKHSGNCVGFCGNSCDWVNEWMTPHALMHSAHTWGVIHSFINKGVCTDCNAHRLSNVDPKNVGVFHGDFATIVWKFAGDFCENFMRIVVIESMNEWLLMHSCHDSTHVRSHWFIHKQRYLHRLHTCEQLFIHSQTKVSAQAVCTSLK